MNDALVICTADSERQVQAVTDHVDKALEGKGYRLYGLEGTEAGLWVLMDFDDVVVHIFKRGVRETYGLDRLWSDAKRLPLPKAQSAVAEPAPSRQPARQGSVRQRG